MRCRLRGIPRTSRIRTAGYSPQAGQAATAHVVDLLAMLAARLKAQHAAGSDYYVGNSLTAVDVYSASVLLELPLAL